MANPMHKPTLYNDAATAWLMQQSKAALADMLTEVLRLDSGRCDDEATAEYAAERFQPILDARKGLRGLPKNLDAGTRNAWVESGGWYPAT